MQQLELERERAQVDRSILDMSADLAAAQRDQVVHRPSLSLENIRKQARDEWLALRAERLAKEQSTAAEKATDTPATPAEGFQFVSAEERQSVENWLAYRRAQLLNPDHKPEEFPISSRVGTRNVIAGAMMISGCSSTRRSLRMRSFQGPSCSTLRI